MAELTKQQIGDGSDNYGQAAGQMAKAAKQAGQEAAKQAASKGAEATVNAAAATVQASVEGGKAAAEIAAGTAMGGPWGAILSAAWSLRHTLFKILICICLALVFLITVIVSLPSIVTNSIFGLDGVQPADGATLAAAYSDMTGTVSDAVSRGYDLSIAKVDQIITDGGYDYQLSMDAIINYAQSSSGYDVSYILAAYSASMQQQNTSEADMIAKLDSIADQMFPVTYEEKEQEITIPVTYYTYKPIIMGIFRHTDCYGFSFCIVLPRPAHSCHTATSTLIFIILFVRQKVNPPCTVRSCVDLKSTMSTSSIFTESLQKFFKDFAIYECNSINFIDCLRFLR